MTITRRMRPTEEQARWNIHANIRLGVEQVNFHLPQSTPIALCAGGPSLSKSLEEIRKLQMTGAEVVCVGNAGHLLAAENIKPNGHIIMDGVERNRTFVVPIPDTRYFVASQCDPKVFEALRFHDHVYIWHAKGVPGLEEILDEHYGKGGYWLVPGGSYISLRAIPLLRMLGYTKFHVYGLDSCLMEDEHHAYSQPNADAQKSADITVGERVFRCTYWMMDQATQFVDMAKAGLFADSDIAVHGDGLIAHMLESGALPNWRP